VWLRLTDQWANLSSFASLAAEPFRCKMGWSEALRKISISFQLTGPMPVPSALATASLAAKRAARDAAFSPTSASSADVKIRCKKRSP